MSVPAAYVGVILIWTTTPLAIKWSGEGSHFLFGASGRMVIGALLGMVLLKLLRVPFPVDRRARQTYLVCGSGIFASMLCTYWGAQYLPSGWISVIFGLNPIFTGILAGFWLPEKGLTWFKAGGALLGVAGLLVIFGRSAGGGPQMLLGLLAVLLATVIHCTSGIWVKRLGRAVPALAVTVGGVSVSVPLFALAWLVLGLGWPEQITQRGALSILYLGVVGSVLGFVLYFFVLKHVEATRVALITLVTPISALMLGHWLNGEPLSVSVWWGTALILGGLLLFEFGGRLPALRQRRQPTAPGPLG